VAKTGERPNRCFNCEMREALVALSLNFKVDVESQQTLIDAFASFPPVTIKQVPHDCPYCQCHLNGGGT